MNDLIKINYDNDRPTVSGRELHQFLEVKTAYKDWFPRMCEYGFLEGQDFCSFLSESTGGRPGQDAQITIDMAKEICMLQRNERGKQARQYFIQLEKDWNSPEKVMARALQIADRKINSLEIENARHKQMIGEMRPKALFADAVAASHTSILIGDLAKLLKQNGVEIGQKRLFAWLRENGYLIRRKGADWNMPTQKAMERRLFEVKESTVNNPDGSVKINRTTKVTGKGQLYFINRFLQKPCAGQSHDLRLDRPE